MKHKKVCTALSYIEHLLILAFEVTEFVSISLFASLVGIPIGIAISGAGLNICGITAGIKKYRSIIKNKRKKHDKKLYTIEVLIFKAFIDSHISHNEFVLVNNVLREHDDMKESIKNLKTSTVHQRF